MREARGDVSPFLSFGIILFAFFFPYLSSSSGDLFVRLAAFRLHNALLDKSEKVVASFSNISQARVHSSNRLSDQSHREAAIPAADENG